MGALFVSRDDALARLITRRLTEQSGHTVFVEHGQDALAMLERHSGSGHGEFDVVVVDGHLASMDALELLQAIRRIDNTIDVVMLTETISRLSCSYMGRVFRQLGADTCMCTCRIAHGSQNVAAALEDKVNPDHHRGHGCPLADLTGTGERCRDVMLTALTEF